MIKPDLLMADYCDSQMALRPKMMVASPLYRNNAFRAEEQNRVLEALTGKQIIPSIAPGLKGGIETGTMPFFKAEAPPIMS